IEGGATVTLAGLTIADGSASGTTVTGPLGPATLGGGILNDQGNLTLSHVTLANNRAAGFIGGGGGVANIYGSTLTVEDSTFTDNQARGGDGAPGGNAGQGAGGAISISGGPALPAVGGTTVADVSHSTFTGNQATGGAGGAGGGNGGVGQGGAISQANATL